MDDLFLEGGGSPPGMGGSFRDVGGLKSGAGRSLRDAGTRFAVRTVQTSERFILIPERTVRSGIAEDHSPNGTQMFLT
jgi:hypothetical protein